jgi:hypothetical protein
MIGARSTAARSIARCAVLAALAALALAGCLNSTSSRCHDGLTCPAGTMCSPSGDVCVDSDLVIACRSAEDGMPCSVAGIPPASCLGGVCQASRCGDGRVTGGEQCEGNLMKAQTCQTLGFYEATGLRCGADCKFDTSQCVGRCGDGIKNGKEQCDGADLGHATCFTAGFYAAKGLACKPDCTFDTAACSGGRCGDGIINGLEQCDGNNFNNTCDGLGFAGAMSGLACTAHCTFSSEQSCLCGTGKRCRAKTQHCDCSKFGCGCVDNKAP